MKATRKSEYHRGCASKAVCDTIKVKRESEDGSRYMEGWCCGSQACNQAPEKITSYRLFSVINVMMISQVLIKMMSV